MLNYNRDDINSKTFSFIYGCALRDAILQKAFKGKKDWIAKIYPAQEAVKEYIDRILNGDFKEDDDKIKCAHDEVFIQTAVKLCKAINDKKPQEAEDNFSFGNAQKLINMVVKHIYAHTYSIHFIGNKDIRDYFRFCHCPMDSIMLLNVWKTYKSTFDSSERKDKLGESNDFLKAWGNEDFDEDNKAPQRYIRYQSAIKEIINSSKSEIFPIEYDYIVWKNE